MQIDKNAKVKFFLIMPYIFGSSDMEGKLNQSLPANYELYFTLEAAEKALLKTQKDNPDSTYLILESRFTTARHDNVNEYCVIDTIPW